MIGERTIAGSSALTLSSDAAGGMEAAFVPSAGMVGCSLRHRGEELLGQRGGLRTYIEEHSTMGIPLLHPWANRLDGLRYATGGRTVTLDPA
jgi:aldose 1-epimerase